MADSTRSNISEIGLWRTLDAALNRAGEGLRVIEDFHRMIQDDSSLTGLTKRLRHRLGLLAGQLDAHRRLSARDSVRDVGRESSVDSEYCRADAAELVAANWARVQQSLRTLEEFLKLLSPELARQAETLRFESYSVQQSSQLSLVAGRAIPNPCLYVLLDGNRDLDSFRQAAARLVAAGVDLIQLRDKSLDDRELLERGRCLTDLTAETNVEWIMNDRIDLALAAGARGVHLGQEELPLKSAREIAGHRLWVGISTHNLEQAKSAFECGADYIGVGPTFPSRTKHFADFPGIGFVRLVAEQIPIPAFAIGGIDAGNVGQIVEAGLNRVAVGRAITHAADPASAVAQIRNQLLRSAAPRSTSGD